MGWWCVRSMGPTHPSPHQAPLGLPLGGVGMSGMPFLVGGVSWVVQGGVVVWVWWGVWGPWGMPSQGSPPNLPGPHPLRVP